MMQILSSWEAEFGFSQEGVNLALIEEHIVKQI